MPDQDAEMLETLMARVMRLLSMHLDMPLTDLAAVPLSAAEGSLLVELLTSREATQQQIADRLSIDKSRVSRVCAALERKHLLARERDDSNRRNLRVRLTDSGQEAAGKLRHAWRAYHERMLAAMTPEERHSLLLGLTAFVREISVVHQDMSQHGHSPARPARQTAAEP